MTWKDTFQSINEAAMEVVWWMLMAIIVSVPFFVIITLILAFVVFIVYIIEGKP